MYFFLSPIPYSLFALQRMDIYPFGPHIKNVDYPKNYMDPAPTSTLILPKRILKPRRRGGHPV